ncbi:MAG: hypothetical protein OXN17_08965 [Candidatus Poribacteria bacterium]|nr:hypothetical protein [Candidatus Poribacteria bacterium]MDE0505571.1 hypothetical protein [Candidatus Poribacteria bacterium]
MTTIRIWAVESDYDAKAVERLATKLAEHLQLRNLSIQVSGKQALAHRQLDKATRNYLKEAACVIFVIDQDSPMFLHQRRQQPNSLINQVEQLVNDSSLDGRVFLVFAIQELEAWLLIDCLGIFCYFASQRGRYRNNCRDRVSENKDFARMIDSEQKGDTEKIVEPESGGKGAKEYLERFSERILLKLNPNRRRKNVENERYREAMSPMMAEHVVIDRETLKWNNSLRYFGEVLAHFK